MNPRDVFGRLHVPVVTVEQAVAHDRTAREIHDISEAVLMANAGRALALVTHALTPAGRIVGVAGPGHNGGDTRIAIMTLRSWGRDAVLRRADENAEDARIDLAGAAVILDGLIGTGAEGPPRGNVAQWIRAINEADRPVIAVDLPSGTNATTGAVYDNAVNAVATVSFGFPKLGLLQHPARGKCGRLIVADIGFPEVESSEFQLITPQWAARHFPRRPPTANKGTSGRLLLLAGSIGMAGAAVLAGSAAVRSGAGLVRIMSSEENREILQRTVPEATFANRDQIDAVESMTTIVAGPGMGATDETRALIAAVRRKLSAAPMVLDADGLNVFAGDLPGLKHIAEERPLLITPHLRELARLSGRALDEIKRDPIAAAKEVSARTGAVVLLKGQPSAVIAGSDPTLINTTGSSDVGVAGMGDQLAGTIGAMVAAGLDVRTAAAVGLFFAGRAADLADMGRALGPQDVTAHLAAAFANPGAQTSITNLAFITFDQPAPR